MFHSIIIYLGGLMNVEFLVHYKELSFFLILLRKCNKYIFKSHLRFRDLELFAYVDIWLQNTSLYIYFEFYIPDLYFVIYIKKSSFFLLYFTLAYLPFPIFFTKV